jgi:hypothetical protein
MVMSNTSPSSSKEVHLSFQTSSPSLIQISRHRKSMHPALYKGAIVKNRTTVLSDSRTQDPVS